VLGAAAEMVTSRRASADVSKHDAELAWWERELAYYVEWYEGERPLYGVSPPEPHERRVGMSVEASACLTFLDKTSNRYPDSLKISPRHFAGRKILDLGCGPLPYSSIFEDCVVIGLDPLVKKYAEAGFPLGDYSGTFTFVAGVAEDMPFPARSFDGLVSVNALDHVDDFARTASEIRRVLKEDAIVRIKVDYHAPKPLEPVAVSDDLVMAHLGDLGIEKVRDHGIPRSAYRDPEAARETDDRERGVVWANEITRASG